MTGQSGQRVFEFRDFRLIPEERLLLRNGEPVELRPKVFATLLFLVEHHGHLVPKTELMDEVWGDAFVEENVIAKSVCAIRQALGGDLKDARFIQTVPKRGYRFVAEVKALTTDARSLIVLPFNNASEDPAQDYFVDGMADALVTDLSKIRELRVIGRSSVPQYRGKANGLDQLGKTLDADRLLKGSVARSGDRVRIDVQLIQANTGEDIWAGSFDRDLRDVVTLQKEVARSIAREVRIQLSPQEQKHLDAAGSVDPDAYDHYLRGRFYLNRQNRRDQDIAIGLLERAVEIDPTFAAAYAELAQAYTWKHFSFAHEETELAEKEFVATEKALSMDPGLASAYLARGRLLWTPANHFPHEKAIRDYHRALELNPNLAEARNQLALVYCHIGALDEALRESYEGAKANPTNNLIQLRIGQTLNSQTKYEEALIVLRGIPDEVHPSVVGHQTAWALFNLGRKEEASEKLQRLLENHSDIGGTFASLQAVIAGSEGRDDDAEELIKQAIEKGKGFGHFHHTAYTIACAYALMNRRGEAIGWIEEASETGFPCYPLFERDANLDNLRQEPRFVTFLNKSKTQWERFKAVL
jgi:TolB-like protein/Tfp pilus assembly protein PilF